MKYLSLFTGAGGGDLAYQHFLGWECIGYVEWDTYCQRVIRQRIDDGVFDRAPIFGDVREFVQSGAADEYRGFADVVTGGFPCQPFSEAGKRRGHEDERNMWPATLAVVRAVKPAYCLFENVPALVASRYFGTIVSDLAHSGYGVRWRVLSGAEMGAPHLRDRVWIVAHTEGKQQWLSGAGSGVSRSATVPQERGELFGGPGDGHMARIGAAWWETEPAVQRMADGDATWSDRHRAIGNAQIPAVAATAWHLLTEDWRSG